MIYRPHMTSPELRALLADPYSPQWDVDEARTELRRRDLHVQTNRNTRNTAGEAV